MAHDVNREPLPLAWSAILENTPVRSSDGVDVGMVYEVLGAEDVFHGLVIHAAKDRREVFVPADVVSAISDQQIELSILAEDVEHLSSRPAPETFKLGFTGLFNRTLSWTREENPHS